MNFRVDYSKTTRDGHYILEMTGWFETKEQMFAWVDAHPSYKVEDYYVHCTREEIEKYF